MSKKHILVSDMTLLYTALIMQVFLVIFISVKFDRYDTEIDKLQSTQTKLEKRVDNLQQAMQTKDKELEAGLRNTQTGLMLKIDYLEKQIGESE